MKSDTKNLPVPTHGYLVMLSARNTYSTRTVDFLLPRFINKLEPKFRDSLKVIISGHVGRKQSHNIVILVHSIASVVLGSAV